MRERILPTKLPNRINLDNKYDDSYRELVEDMLSDKRIESTRHQHDSNDRDYRPHEISHVLAWQNSRREELRDVLQSRIVPALEAIQNKQNARLTPDIRNPGLGTCISFPKVFLDGDYGIVASGESPAYVLGFDLPETGALRVRQLQSHPDRTEEAKEVFGKSRWEKELVIIAEELSKALDISQISIQSAANNGWAKTGGMKPEVAKMHYDVTAQRLGYKLGPDNNWHKWLG